jgi:hypothetical protein
MSIESMVPSGKYAVLETPRLLARKSGNLKNQYALDATDFATIPAQNGMLLVVDEYNKSVKLPDAITDSVWVHCSAIKDYQNLGKDTVAVSRGELLPAMYKAVKGDVIITNCVKYDTNTYATVAAITAAIDASTVYGIPDTSGYIKAIATLGGSEICAWKARQMTTSANGATAIEFVCVLAG